MGQGNYINFTIQYYAETHLKGINLGQDEVSDLLKKLTNGNTLKLLTYSFPMKCSGSIDTKNQSIVSANIELQLPTNTNLQIAFDPIKTSRIQDVTKKIP